LQIPIDAVEVLENNHYLEGSGWSCEDWLENPKNGKIALINTYGWMYVLINTYFKMVYFSFYFSFRQAIVL
jgi:hypothetical protein